MDSSEFSKILRTEEKEVELVQSILKDLRKDVAEFFLSREDTEDFFDLTPVIRKWKKHPEIVESVVRLLREEIEEASFKTKLGYGDTGLFIYTDAVPSNCW
jgi:hypothetical protein